MKFYDILAKESKNEKEEYEYLNLLDSPHLFKEIKNFKGKKVLEIGSGTGRITEKIINEKPQTLVSIESSTKKIILITSIYSKNLFLKQMMVFGVIVFVI